MTRALNLTSLRQPSGPDPEVELRVLATTDLHAHLYPFDYYTDTRDDAVGLAGLVGSIANLRLHHPNVLLVDNGDTLVGSPLGDAAASKSPGQAAVHPMISAMNALGYDAATVGNHDFDYGLDHLRASYLNAKFPVVLANATEMPVQKSLFQRHVILNRSVTDSEGSSHKLQIGITGAAPPQIAEWSKTQLDGAVIMEGMVATVAREVHLMRQAGADIVIVLAHTGIGTGDAAPTAENAAGALAALPGVDLVVAGHTHRTFPRPERPDLPLSVDLDRGLIAGTPVVQPGFWGSHLGVVDLRFRREQLAAIPVGTDLAVEETSVQWCLASAQVELVPRPKSKNRVSKTAVAAIMQAHPTLRRQLASSHRATRKFTATPLGETAVHLETYFSQISPCAATQLVADAQFSAVAPIIADHPDLRLLPVLSAVAPFKSGGRSGGRHYTDVAPGPLLFRHAADLYLYPNTLSLLCLTGGQVHDWLENVASIFRTIVPTQAAPQPLIDPEFASYNFDRIVGLTYDIDVSQLPRADVHGATLNPESKRIRNLRFSGTQKELAPDDRVLVATNSYRAAGGGQMPGLQHCLRVETPATLVREIVADHIRSANAPLAPNVDATWGFTPLGGVEVTFDTGVGAAAHSARATSLGARRIGPAAEIDFDTYMLKI